MGKDRPARPVANYQRPVVDDSRCLRRFPWFHCTAPMKYSAGLIMNSNISCAFTTKTIRDVLGEQTFEPRGTRLYPHWNVCKRKRFLQHADPGPKCSESSRMFMLHCYFGISLQLHMQLLTIGWAIYFGSAAIEPTQICFGRSPGPAITCSSHEPRGSCIFA